MKRNLAVAAASLLIISAAASASPRVSKILGDLARGLTTDAIMRNSTPGGTGYIPCSTSTTTATWQTPASCGISGGGSTPTSLYTPNLFIWTSTGVTSPFLRGTVVKIGSTLYAFGGYATSGVINENHIWTAALSSPTSWTDQGALLPSGACSSWDGLRVAVLGTDLYAFGSEGGCSEILHSTTSSPLTWTDTGHAIDSRRDNAPIVVADGFIIIPFGHNGTSGLASIGYATTSAPTTWSTATTSASARWIVSAAWAGNRIYTLGGGGGGFTNAILGTWTENPQAVPLSWTVTGLDIDNCAETVLLDGSIYVFGTADARMIQITPGLESVPVTFTSILPETNQYIRHARWIGSDGYMYMVQGSGTNAGRIYKSGRDEVLVWNYDSTKIQDYPAIFGTSSDKAGQATTYSIQVQRDGVPAWWTNRTDPF